MGGQLSLASATKNAKKLLIPPPRSPGCRTEVCWHRARPASGWGHVLGTSRPNMGWVGSVCGTLARGNRVGPPAPSTSTEVFFFRLFYTCALWYKFLSWSSWGRCFTNSHFAAAAKRDSRTSETVGARFRNVFPPPVPNRF